MPLVRKGEIVMMERHLKRMADLMKRRSTMRVSVQVTRERAPQTQRKRMRGRGRRLVSIVMKGR